MSHPHGAGEACPLSKEFEHDTLKNIKYPFTPDKSTSTEHHDLIEKAAVMAMKVGEDPEATHKAFELPPRLPASPLLAQKVLLQSAMDRMNRGFEADQGLSENADQPCLDPKPPALGTGPTISGKLHELNQQAIGTAKQGKTGASRGHPSA
jgi:hypothetical protein